MTREDAVRQARSLLRLAARGGTPEEAAAAARAQAVIDRWDLTEAAIGGAQETERAEEPMRSFGTEPEGWIGVAPQRSRWHSRLASKIARQNGCYVYRDRRASSGWSIEIVGRPSDVDTVRYLYAWLSGEVERLVNGRGKGMGESWRQEFAAGAVETIAERLAEQRRETAREVAGDLSHLGPLFAEAGRGAALVRIETALAQYDVRAREADALAHRLVPGLRSTCSTYTPNHTAREAGRQAGRSVALGRASGMIGGGPRQLRGRS